MPVPETAMNKNYCSVFRQDDIGSARKVFAVKPETETHSVQQRPDSEFRLRVLAPDLGHVPATPLAGDCVGHVDFSPEIKIFG